jgi:hypothetical protein
MANEHTAISIKVVHEQSGKIEYERERLLGIANKLTNFQSDPSSLSRSYYYYLLLLLLFSHLLTRCLINPTITKYIYTN